MGFLLYVKTKKTSIKSKGVQALAKHNNIFPQLLNYFELRAFKKSASECEADKYVKKFFSKDLLLTLSYGQLADKNSLRQLEYSLNSHAALRKRLGMPEVHRNTISQALSNRPSELFIDHFNRIFQRLNNLCFKRLKAGAKLIALDATFIRLPIRLFDWARYRKEDRGIKLHFIFDATDEIPEYFRFSLGDEQELSVAKEFYHRIPKDRIVVCDKAYFSWEFLKKMEDDSVKFVIPDKNNLVFEVECEIPPANLPSGVIADQIVVFNSQIAAKHKPVVFRRIVVWNERKYKEVAYITNLWDEDAEFILDLYRRRWKIEFFFRWLKQNLKVTSFWGTTQNAVEIQLWVAMMVAIVLKFLALSAKAGKNYQSVFYLKHLLADMLFERTNLKILLNTCITNT
jgi:hypothetical protein